MMYQNCKLYITLSAGIGTEMDIICTEVDVYQKYNPLCTKIDMSCTCRYMSKLTCTDSSIKTLAKP